MFSFALVSYTLGVIVFIFLFVALIANANLTGFRLNRVQLPLMLILFICLSTASFGYWFVSPSLISFSFFEETCYLSQDALGSAPRFSLSSASAICGEFRLIYFPFFYAFVLITLITLVFCFAYNSRELASFSVYVSIILFAGFGLFVTNSLLLFFFLYEVLLLPSFFILYKFAKTRKAVEAAFLMFFWTQFGALFLIINFQYIFFITNSFNFSDFRYMPSSSFEVKFLLLTSLVGFGVKFPIWPFYEWLPKAHVEASTNFSIFLSGVLVKFAFFGFFKYNINLNIDFTAVSLYPFLLIGLCDSVLKLFYQIDLKKIVAYSTVVEMHWLLMALLSGTSLLWVAASAMLVSHAILSSLLFISIDFVTRRFKTRLTTEVGGLYYLAPDLYSFIIVILVIFLGFPGTLFFLAEFLFFSFVADINLPLFFITFGLVYLLLPIGFIKNWFLLLFGFNFNYTLPTLSGKSTEILLDLSLFEKTLLGFLLFQIIWLGFSFQSLFF